MRYKIVCIIICLTLIMWHNRFSENENEAVKAHIPRHQDSKTKKPRYRDSKTKKPRHRDSKTKKPRHRETETNKRRHHDSKAFFQRTKSHGIEIPRLKNRDMEIPRPKRHDIEFLWNSDPYAPWYSWLETDATSGVEVAATGFEPTTIYLANNLASENGRMVKWLNFAKWLRVLYELQVFMD